MHVWCSALAELQGGSAGVCMHSTTCCSCQLPAPLTQLSLAGAGWPGWREVILHSAELIQLADQYAVHGSPACPVRSMLVAPHRFGAPARAWHRRACSHSCGRTATLQRHLHRLRLGGCRLRVLL